MTDAKGSEYKINGQRLKVYLEPDCEEQRKQSIEQKVNYAQASLDGPQSTKVNYSRESEDQDVYLFSRDIRNAGQQKYDREGLSNQDKRKSY